MIDTATLQSILINVTILFLGYVGRQVLVYIKNQKSKDEAYRAGIVALLRYHIMKTAQEACKNGKLSAEYRVNLQEMYTAYHGLGANGVVTEWYNIAMDLPVDNSGIMQYQS